MFWICVFKEPSIKGPNCLEFSKLVGRLVFLAGRPPCKQNLVGDTGRWAAILLGGLPGPFVPPVNFGDDWSPRLSRKYKKSALFGAKCLCGNFNSSLRCVARRYSPRARCILFEYVVTRPRGKPEGAVELPSSRLAFLCSMHCFKHAFEVALVLHCYAHYLHCCTRFIGIAMHPYFACVGTHVSLAVLCTFPSAPYVSAFDMALSMCC